MRRYRVGLLSLMMVTMTVCNPASAGTRDMPSTDAEKDDASRAYIACQADQAAKLDDGFSDAMMVGRAIAVSCRAEMESLAAVLARGSKRDRVRNLLIDRLASHAAQDASVIVLLERKRRADDGANPR